MRVEISSPIPIDYFEKQPASGPAKQIVLILHGYEQGGEWILLRAEDAIPSDARAISLNGPFPLPKYLEASYLVGFAWYFFDPYEERYVVEPKYAVAFLKKLIDRLNTERLPITIIGFSQGGNLAPFLAVEIPEVRRIIGIGCQFLADEIDVSVLVKRNVRMDALHGAQDELVNPAKSRALHDSLKKAGIAGSFQDFPNTGHKLTDEIWSRVATLLRDEG